MRTTLDLDSRVMAAARGRARAKHITLGQAVSELAWLGIEAERDRTAVVDDGFPALPPVPGHVITSDMVAAALADDG